MAVTGKMVLLSFVFVFAFYGCCPSNMPCGGSLPVDSASPEISEVTAAVQTLIDAGANLDVTAKWGLSATMLAVINHHESVARALAAAGANLQLVGTGAGFTDKSAAQLALDIDEQELAKVLA